MSNIEATKFYIRHREGYPETEMQDYARRGFWTLGIETSTYEWIDDINNMKDLSRTVGIAGYIGDIHKGLEKLNKSIPLNIDYPEKLSDFMGRNVRIGSIEDVRASITPVFVKPLEHKAFSGFVWRPDKESRMRIVTQHEDSPVWMSEVIEFVAEYRSFILYNKIIDCRKYKGDWSIAPDKEILKSAVKIMKNTAPKAYCLDWGITKDGRTILVEMNEGYAFGHYGLHPVSYARMLSARWYEMTSLK